MYLLILPVSGGGFVTQLAILQHLCEINFVPNLTLASSGGNVAAYIASAADWKWSKIEKIAADLSNNLFMQCWNNISFISVIIGYYQGAMYNRGFGVKSLLTKYFDKKSITKYEIWTGTYNKQRQKAMLFCNRNTETSVIDSSVIDLDLTQSMDPVYADGDINLISDAAIASASIPAIVPPQKIMGEDYMDGGIAGASPLSVMHEPILKKVNENNSPLHIVYVNSIDLSKSAACNVTNVLDIWKQATHSLIRSQTVIDRLSGYELLRCYPGKMNREDFPCNYDNLQRIKKMQKTIKYSMLEIYPTENNDIDISKFCGTDVINCIHKAYKVCNCRFWWLSTDYITADDYNNISLLIDECKNSVNV